jgi:hypothetical protein
VEEVKHTKKHNNAMGLSTATPETYAISDNAVKKMNCTILETRRILPCGNKSAGGRSILLGEKSGSGAAMLRAVRFQCIEVWVSIGYSCTNKYIQLTKRTLNFDRRRAFGNVAAA